MLLILFENISKLTYVNIILNIYYKFSSSKVITTKLYNNRVG